MSILGIGPQIGMVLGGLALLGGAYGLHAHAVHAAHDSAFSAGVKSERDRAEAAQATVDRLATAKVAKTITGQAAVSKEKSDALYHAVDDIDARAHQLGVRHAAARAAAPRDLPATGPAAGQSCPPPAADGLPWAIALPAMTQAAKDLAQLNAILDHEEAQAALIAPQP